MGFSLNPFSDVASAGNYVGGLFGNNTSPTSAPNIANYIPINGTGLGPVGGGTASGAFAPSGGGTPGSGAGQTGATNQAAAQAALSSGGSAGSGVSAAADVLASLNDNANQLNSLLGRTDTALNQGLQQNQNQYDEALSNENTQNQRALDAYTTQGQQNTQSKQAAYDTINKNAGTGYNSLAQIIGRAAGTGSSAFQDLLPNVVGNDTSAKRAAASSTYGQNQQAIDKAQGITEDDYNSALADLLRQKNQNESDVRSGVETQRQQIQQQLSDNAAQIAQANGGGYAAVKAAESPYQNAINNSKNAVEALFSQFNTPFTPAAVTAAPADLGQYTTDRSAINAQAQGANPTDPYSAFLLRKNLQDGTV